MPQDWDDTIKRLIRAYPQHFVSLVLKGAVYKDALSIELKNWTREADFLLEVTLEEEEMLLHLEFQSRDDEHMAQRLLEYNVLARREHKRSVYSCVIYLRESSNIPESPLVWKLSNGHEILRFHFGVIKLWELPAEEIIQTGLVGLIPLLPLTKGGKRQELVKEMVEDIVAVGEYRLLPLAKAFATLVFKEGAEREWLERIFMVYQDIIEDSWFYQETLQKGKLEALHHTLMSYLQVHFPELVPLAKKYTDTIDNPEALQNLIDKMFASRTEEEVIQHLLSVGKEERRNGKTSGV